MIAVLKPLVVITKGSVMMICRSATEVWAGAVASLTSTRKAKVPVAEGRPESTPLAGSKLSPGGKVPTVCCHA